MSAFHGDVMARIKPVRGLRTPQYWVTPWQGIQWPPMKRYTPV